MGRGYVYRTVTTVLLAQERSLEELGSPGGCCDHRKKSREERVGFFMRLSERLELDFSAT